MKQLVVLLLSFAFLAACGQKGPLFLPGDPSAIRTTTPQQQQPAEENEDDDEDEDEIPITNHE
jgi:predicted small lipoprotein YifL